MPASASDREYIEMRHKGKIARWDDDKGFGFITPNNGGPEVFIHVKAFENRNRRPEADDVVAYSIAKDEQGRTRAVDARLSGGRMTTRAQQKPGKPAVPFSALFSVLFALCFLGGVGVTVYVNNLPVAFLYWYLAASFVTFLIYAKDKSAAQKGNRRTKENTLFVFGLAGGWPGALIAQETLRHKSRKTSFQVVFAITVVLNGAALIWLHTADGQVFIRPYLPYLNLPH